MISRLLIFLSFIGFSMETFAQNLIPETHWWIPYGTVKAIATDTVTNTVYIGGDFASVGKKEPYGTQVSYFNGTPNFNFDNPNDVVYESVSDGNGGWYFSGEFTKVGDSIRNGLAHVNNLGKVSSIFSNKKGFNNTVKTLTVKGDTLYCGGDFNGYGDDFHSFGVQIDTTTGLPATNFSDPNGEVKTVIPDGSGGWFIGGAFTMVGDSSRSHLAHLDSLGNVTSFSPSVDNVVDKIFKSGNKLYFAGDYSYINGIQRSGIACFDLVGDSITSWNPSPIGQVREVLVIDSNVFVGGSFSNIGGQSRSRFAILDTVAGFAINTPSNLIFNGAVLSLYESNGTLFIGGSFTQIDFVTKKGLASMDLSTHTIKSWNPNVNGWVSTMEMADTMLWVGGSFNQVGNITRHNITKIDTSTGIGSFVANIYDPIFDLALMGDTMFVSGGFNKINNFFIRNGLVSININTNLITDQKVNSNNFISCIGTQEGSIYLGGGFSKLGGTTRNFLAAINVITGNLLPWYPKPNNRVNTILYQNNRLFVAGDFNKIGNQPRFFLSEFGFDSDTSLNISSRINPSTATGINSLVLFGDTLIMGGKFQEVQNTMQVILSRKNLAALDLSTNLITSWAPTTDDVGTNTGYVTHLSRLDNNLYIAGEFNQVNGDIRNNIAKINLLTGNTELWNPNISVGLINALVTIDSSVFVGLDNYYLYERFISFDTILGDEQEFRCKVFGQVKTISHRNGSFFIGGDYASIGGEERHGVAALNGFTGELTDWDPQLRDTIIHVVRINDLALNGNTLYMGGQFTHVGSVHRLLLAGVNKYTGNCSSFNPNISTASSQGEINCILINGDSLIVGGLFSQLGGVTRNNFGSFSISSGLVSTWNPNVNGKVRDILIHNNNIYLAGYFYLVGGQPRNRLVKLDLSTGLVSSWNANISLSGGAIEKVIAMDTTIYFCVTHGGNNLIVAGQTFPGGAASVSEFNGGLESWVNGAQIPILTMEIVDTSIYFGGSGFNYGILHPGMVEVDLINGIPNSFNSGEDRIFNNYVSFGQGYVKIHEIDLSQDRVFVGGLFSVRNESQFNFTALSTCNPQIYFQPQSQTFCNGSDGIFSASATGSNNSYQWQINTGSGFINVVNDTTFQGADSTHLAISNVTSSLNGYTFRCVAMGACAPSDTTNVVSLTVGYPSSATVIDTVCDFYVAPSGTVFTNSGVYQDTSLNTAGCDSIVLLNLTVLNSTTDTTTFIVCDTVTWRGNLYNSTGLYFDTIMNAAGCDSILVLNLTVQSTSNTISVSTCNPYSSPSGNFVWATSGVYQDTLINAVGCDSLITVNLSVNSNNSAISVISCDSFSSPSGLFTWTISGNYSDTLTNSLGCDSVLSINLIINTSDTSSQTITSCDSLISPSGSSTWTTSGSYLDTLQNMYGCDSVITTNLTIFNSTNSITNEVVCDSFYWAAIDTTYYLSGIYYDTLINAVGCDSNLTLNLTVNNSYIDTQFVVECNSYYWPIDGNTYLNNGYYLFIAQNQFGCDSTTVLELTINDSSSSSISITSCDSFSSPSGNYTWFTTGVYSDTIMNSVGCDSIISVNLIINNSSSTVLNITSCDSFSWASNGLSYYTTGMYIDTVTNINGCDSVNTLFLTINSSSFATDTYSVCDSLTWIDGITYTSSNNTATDTLVNSIGCDSIITLNLTIHNSTTGVDTQFACDSLTWINGVTYSSSNTTAVDTLTTVNGCDSIVTLNLTISNLNANYSWVDNGSGNYSFINSSTGNYTNSHWAFGDGITSTTTNPSHAYSANGTYVVVLAIHDSNVVGDSCISYFTDTIVVTGASNSTQCNAGWVVFADSSTGGVTIVNSSTGTNLTYHWDFGDGDTSNLQFPSHTYASNGPFNLCLTINDGNGCSDTYCDSISSNGVLFKNGFDLNVVANYPLGIQNIGNEPDVNIYPNPTSSQLNIETQNFKITKIQIRDNSGKVVKTITSNFDVVNVENLATGVYHLELIGKDETITKKFIKQ